MTGPFYYLGNARTDAQRDDMRALAATGACVFCPEQLAVDENQPILHRTPLWTVTPNEFPYAGTKLHLLLVPDEHVTDLLDIRYTIPALPFGLKVTSVRPADDGVHVTVAARDTVLRG